MDYVTYLKGLRMIGQIDPLKKDDGTPAYALLVSVEPALAECIGWSKQNMTRKEFLAYLKENDILVFSNIEEFIKWKKTKIKPSEMKKKFKRNISEERRNQLKNQINSVRPGKIPSTSENT